MNLKPAIVYFFVIGVLLFLITVYFPPLNSGPYKYTSVVNILRQTEAAKEEWAIENGYTNAADTHRVLTQKDITPYVAFQKDQFGLALIKMVFFPLRA